MDATTRASFEELSKLLTGEAQLDAGLVEPIYERLFAAFPSEMPKLMKSFDELALKDEASVTIGIVKNSATTKEVLTLVKEIINAWFLGSFFLPGPDHAMQPPATTAPYQKQLMYPVIKAPVRAYSHLAGAKYGDWAEKPAGE